MKFFAKQKVDQIGVTAVTLQKLLLFLMVLSLFTVFNGGLFSFLLCLIGFIGAYKRSPGLLAAYVSISIVLIALCSVVAVSSILMVTSDDYVYEYSSDFSSSSTSSSDIKASDYNGGNVYKFQKLLSRKLYGAGSQSASESSDSVVSSTPNLPNGNSNSLYGDSYSMEEDDTTGFIFLLIVVMLLAFFLAYLKIYSLVLSWRLRKMILCTANTLPVSEPQTHNFPATNTSCAEQEQPTGEPVAPFHPAPPMFAPGFAPYPYGMPFMAPPQFPGQQQFPHHVMFGQQPVFYTYAPMNPTPSAEDEKL